METKLQKQHRWRKKRDQVRLKKQRRVDKLELEQETKLHQSEKDRMSSEGGLI